MAKRGRPPGVKNGQGKGKAKLAPAGSGKSNPFHIGGGLADNNNIGKALAIRGANGAAAAKRGIPAGYKPRKPASGGSGSGGKK